MCICYVKYQAEEFAIEIVKILMKWTNFLKLISQYKHSQLSSTLITLQNIITMSYSYNGETALKGLCEMGRGARD